MTTKDDLIKDEAAMTTLYHRMTNTGPTASEVIKELKEALAPKFGHNIFKIDTGARIGPEDSVYIVYASVPKGSSEVDALNAKSSPMISISSAKGEKWLRGQPAPSKLEAAWFRGTLVGNKNYGSTIKFRKKTDTPAKIIKYVIDFFKTHEKALLDNNRQ